ncbi:sensor histidine kinase [Actinomadura fibrosa]|uniref:Oxygen sensor histidine kinase NreB n=1 Tax=Actinomadura fibrosa TaxID=111802 RepID=A0ABW2XDC0_9ACTN|nr:sensor histidine kinase [Actinomadura fibrosa]
MVNAKTDFLPTRGDIVAELPPWRPEATGPEAASRLEARRAGIMAEYGRVLDEPGGPIASDAAARRQLMANAERILTDVVDSLRAGTVRVDEGYKLTIRETAEAPAPHGVQPRESLRTGIALFDVVQRELFLHLGSGERSQRLLMLALRALYESITVRIGEGVLAHEGYLLDKIHKAQVEERRRIGRDLHDRVGLWLSAAYRQLELYDLDASGKENCLGTEKRLTAAYDAVREAMRILREITSELRFCEPSDSLEKALLTAFEAVATGDAAVQLKINGDEVWAPPAVKDESFLIVREAVRNAVVHGRAGIVLVRIDIAPREMRIYVDDNGGGFDPRRTATSGGVGLSTMRERAELVGGTLAVSSAPGEGTHVELFIPLPGSEDGRQGS